jgi:hypothetical protein
VREPRRDRRRSPTCTAQSQSQGEDLFALALCMWASGGDRAEARAHATAARDMFKTAGPKATKQLTEAERWVADPEHFVRTPGDPL